MKRLCFLIDCFILGLSMEEVFILTGLQILFVMFCIFLPIILWIEKKKNKKNKDKKSNNTEQLIS